MANHPTVHMPPLANWASQLFAYGFLLTTDKAVDYTGSVSNNVGVTFSQPDSDRVHLLNLNPQDYSEDEPVATEISSAMGGGKVIESRGWITKQVSIKGTTGFLPPIASYASHMKPYAVKALVGNRGGGATDSKHDDIVTEEDGKAASGFYEFYRLRNLFRTFMEERKLGKSVQMHFLNFKADEFWLVEPNRFRMQRTRFGYTYDIGITLITPSHTANTIAFGDQGGIGSFGGQGSQLSSGTSGGSDQGAALIALLRNPLPTSFDSVTQSALTRLGQQYDSVKAFIGTYASGVGVLTLKLQDILSKIDTIQKLFGDLASLRRSTLDVPLMLYKQLYSSLQGTWDAFLSITPEAFKADINEMLIEMQTTTEGLISHHSRTYGSTPGDAMAEFNDQYTTQRGSQGTADQFITEDGTSGSPLIDPFIGGSGLGLIGSLQKMVSVTSLRAEYVLTGENIWDVAQRLLNSGSRFLDLIIFNNLRSPYIVSDATSKPEGTIAWGESIMVPVSTQEPQPNAAPPISTTTASFNAITSALNTDFFSVTSIPDSPWRPNMWLGFTLTFTSGALLGETRIVVSNTVDTLVLSRALAVNASVGDAYTMSLVTFHARKAVSPETAAFGRDVLGVFTKSQGLLTDGSIDFLLTPNHDLATVEGLANLEQAVALVMQSPVGSDKSNPGYGTGSIVGRAYEPNIVALYIFYVRLSLLADARIEAVLQPTVEYRNGVLTFSCYIQPIKVQRTLHFSTPIA